MPRKGYTSVTLPSSLVREARKLLKSPTGERYRSLTELASEAIEEKLDVIRGTSIVSTKTVQTEEAKGMIIDYLKNNPGAHYPSDNVFAKYISKHYLSHSIKEAAKEHEKLDT